MTTQNTATVIPTGTLVTQTRIGDQHYPIRQPVDAACYMPAGGIDCFWTVVGSTAVVTKVRTTRTGPGMLARLRANSARANKAHTAAIAAETQRMARGEQMVIRMLTPVAQGAA